MCNLCLMEYYSTTERISLLINKVTCIHIKGKLKDQFQCSRMSSASAIFKGGFFYTCRGPGQTIRKKHTTSVNYAFYTSQDSPTVKAQGIKKSAYFVGGLMK